VLRIDPPTWDEPGVIPDVTPGKRCARLDLRGSSDRAVFLDLLRSADVLVHGYRSDALENLGLDTRTRREIRPGLVDVSLNAYGWSGPWRNRRGFDSLVQMSAGVADAGMRTLGKDRPTPFCWVGMAFCASAMYELASARGHDGQHIQYLSGAWAWAIGGLIGTLVGCSFIAASGAVFSTPLRIPAGKPWYSHYTTLIWSAAMTAVAAGIYIVVHFR
jgi:hypothetical protein